MSCTSRDSPSADPNVRDGSLFQAVVLDVITGEGVRVEKVRFHGPSLGSMSACGGLQNERGAVK